MENTNRLSMSAILVSMYLFIVGLWLLLIKRISAEGIIKLARRLFRGAYTGPLADFSHEQQHCWVAQVPQGLLSDRECASRLVVYEDNRPLGPAHCGHDDIRREGGGRFSHWGAQVYFSTSDNTDPRTNGHNYYVKEV